MEYEIETGVPVGEAHGSRPSAYRSRYPWSRMGLGDSFVVPALTIEECNKRQRAAATAGKIWLERHNKPWRVVTRREEGGVRVWFVEDE